MRPGDVWLHPIHTAASGVETALFVPISISRKLADVQELHAFASKLAHVHQGESVSSGLSLQGSEDNSSLIWRVSLSSNGMVITREGEAPVCSQPLSLFFSEVVHVSAGKQHLIALGCRDDVTEASQSKKKDCRSLVGPFGEVWVLLVEGDEDVLHKVLDAMGALGAIRADFHSIYQLSDSPVGEGVGAQVYRGKLLRPDAKTDLTQTILSRTLNGRRPEAIAAKVFFSLSPDCHESENVTAEAAHLIALQVHPNIISYYGTFTMPAVEVGGAVRWIMALEWCSRGDLHACLMRSFGPCNETDAASILVGLFAALAHVHSRGIVHRDVKAENVLIGEGGKPILSDFGIAAQVDDEQAMMQRCGSPGYAAPEILQCERYDFKVDVFSAGVVLYLLLYTTMPFAGPDITSILRRTANSKVKFPKSFGRVSNEMKNIVLQLLEKKREKRKSAKSALCLLWRGWCRGRSLPEWLRNSDHELAGSSPCESETSSEVEELVHNVPSLSKESSTGVPAGAASAALAMVSFGAAPFGIAFAGSENARHTDNSYSSGFDQQVHQQSSYSSGTESTIATPRTDFGFGDSLLTEGILDSPERSSQNHMTTEMRKSLRGTCNRFWRRMRPSSKTPVTDELGSPITAIAESAKSLRSSYQPCLPKSPKADRVQKFFNNNHDPSGYGCQRRGRRIINPKKLRYAEARSGGIVQEVDGISDEQRLTDTELSSDTKWISSKERLGAKLGKETTGLPDEQRLTDTEPASDTQRLFPEERKIQSSLASSSLRSCRLAHGSHRGAIPRTSFSEFSRWSSSKDKACDDAIPRATMTGEEI